MILYICDVGQNQVIQKSICLLLLLYIVLFFCLYFAIKFERVFGDMIITIVDHDV